MPITSGTWTGDGTGIYQAVGGTLNTSTHRFTTSAVQTGSSGVTIPIDLRSIQRILVNDSATNWSVGASFLNKSKPLNFTATTIGGSELDSLDSLLIPGQSLLGGWNFTTDSGYTPGDPAYLSFGIGSGTINQRYRSLAL